MNKKSRVAFGPGAASIILIMVVLSMSVLGMLALMNARNEAQLSKRSMDVIENVYALNNQAERTLGQLDALVVMYGTHEDLLVRNLPQGVTFEDNVFTWEETDGVRTLYMSAEMQSSGDRRLKVIDHTLYAVAGDE